MSGSTRMRRAHRGRWRWRPGGGAAVAATAAMAASVLAACSTDETVTVVLSPPPATTVIDGATPRPPAGALSLTIAGQPTRTFIVFGGRWKVCDSGTVTNGGSVVAHDVRITATYVDKGVIVGQTSRDEAAADGGALGDLAPGATARFTFCAIARNEPDVDRLTAVAAS
ncbi:MAG TPA: hypothetical protein VFO60_02460 [Candidatus Dormibacteraeota bacterium]|nr:hypothetical protein [Candidatus Dormibacteraeota bacterium]